MSASQPRAGAYLPWSYPAAGGALAGSWGASLVSDGVPSLTLLLLGAGLAAVLAVAGDRLLPGVVPARSLVLATLLALVTGARYLAWERSPDPLAGWHEVETTWRGYHDGVYFRAWEPVRVKLAMAARAAQPQGRLTLVGSAVAAPGKRNPGGFDYAGYLRRRGAAGQLFVTEVTAADGGGPLRERLRLGVEAGLEAEAAALMAAMTLGLREDMGELADSFTAAGLAHLLALSGLHVSLLLMAAGRLLSRWARARPYLLMALTLGFVALVGPSPSVVRAATMALAVLVAMALGSGRPRAWPVFALALTGGLLQAPWMLLDVSFQLSFLAVAGMLLFLPPWARALGLRPADRPGRWRMLILGGGLTSIAAQLPSVSLVAGSFGQLPLLSPLVNIVAVPLSALALPVGFTAGLLGVVWLPLSWLVNRAAAVLAGALVWCARAGERLPSLAWGEVGWSGHLCWLAALCALALWSHGRLRLKRAAGVALAAAACSLLAGSARTPPDVWFLDVGQGDSVLIRLPRGTTVLIDGGGTPFSDFDVGERVVVRALRALGVRRLDVVVATHPDADHIEGLIAVLERLPVGLLVGGPASEAPLDVALRAAADRRGIAVHRATRGERLVLVREDGYALDVLHPPAGAPGGSANELSVALVLRRHGAALAAFFGDLGSASEPWLAPPPVDVLMVGHHGSRHSTGPDILRALSPRLAVISVGRNNYGHPHPDVLGRLERAGVEVLLTQRDGAVRIDLRTGAVSAAAGDAAGGRPGGG